MTKANNAMCSEIKFFVFADWSTSLQFDVWASYNSYHIFQQGQSRKSKMNKIGAKPSKNNRSTKRLPVKVHKEAKPPTNSINIAQQHAVKGAQQQNCNASSFIV